MTEIDPVALWAVILGLGLGSFGLRFVFTGFIGERAMPEWLLRHLRYTAVAILPGLVAPAVVWPAATDGQLDAPRMIAAVVTVAVGYFSKNVLAAIFCGAGSLYLALYLVG